MQVHLEKWPLKRTVCVCLKQINLTCFIMDFTLTMWKINQQKSRSDHISSDKYQIPSSGKTNAYQILGDSGATVFTSSDSAR